MKCKQCGKELSGERIRRHAKFCSKECNKKYFAKKSQTYFGLDLNVGTKGAISELIVCEDLLKKGYEVFRAISPACPCDLMILKNNKSLRVEVRTASISGGKIVHSGNRFNADVLALVLKDKIVYKLNEEEWKI